MIDARTFRALSKKEREKILGRFTIEELAYLKYQWEFWARKDQLPPKGDWLVWLLLAGRGYGKTRTAAEWVRWKIDTGQCKRFALVGQTSAAVRDVMVEGESGLMSVFPPWQRPFYEPSKRRITFHNNAIATTYSADSPELLRGPQHDGAWLDEMAAWKKLRDTYDNLMLGLRLGNRPQCCVSTTPKPKKILSELKKKESTVVTTGSTYMNLDNLSPSFREMIVDRYEGTTLGRQELYAELLDEMPGAAWKRSVIDTNRVSEAPALGRVVVAVDPAVTANSTSDETGIIVAGESSGIGYVLEDLSGRYSPNEWADVVVDAYHRHRANRVVAETNQGGDLVKTNIYTVDPNVSVKTVHANKGKALRAEPISSKYEQGKVKHVGMFEELEDQMCEWVPGERNSPDRLDAMVYAMTELLLGTQVIAAMGGGAVKG